MDDCKVLNLDLGPAYSLDIGDRDEAVGARPTCDADPSAETAKRGIENTAPTNARRTAGARLNRERFWSEAKLKTPCSAARIRGRTCLCPFYAPSAKSMNRSCPSYDFAAMLHSPRDQVLFSRPQSNFLSINDQGVTSLDHNHVLIELMHVLR
jgi:hypothetical protein